MSLPTLGPLIFLSVGLINCCIYPNVRSMVWTSHLVLKTFLYGVKLQIEKSQRASKENKCTSLKPFLTVFHTHLFTRQTRVNSELFLFCKSYKYWEGKVPIQNIKYLWNEQKGGSFKITNLRWPTRYFVNWPTCTLIMNNNI